VVDYRGIFRALALGTPEAREAESAVVGWRGGVFQRRTRRIRILDALG
jgi:hypothetical protein